METKYYQKPSGAFIGASWMALLIGFTAYIIGLWNAEMQLNEKGYYFTVLMFGLFAAISLQKAVAISWKAFLLPTCITASPGLLPSYPLC